MNDDVEKFVSDILYELNFVKEFKRKELISLVRKRDSRRDTLMTERALKSPLAAKALALAEKRGAVEKLKDKIELCQRIKMVDKTLRYQYQGDCDEPSLLEDNGGNLPKKGARWLTPSEIADEEIRMAEKESEKLEREIKAMEGK